MKLYQRRENESAPLGQADPYMIKAGNGRYYLYTTGGHIFSSDRLTEGWRYDGVCLEMPGQKSCWAPCVIQVKGQYYMYYSSLDKEETDDHGQTMRIAVSDLPEGPFRYVKDLIPAFTIDAHVVETPSGLYMFYCNNDYTAKRPGTLIVCDKMKDPYTMDGNPQRIVRPTIDEEIFQKDRFQNGQHWHTIEGAFYFHTNGVHYLMYSGACYQNPSYFIGYSIAYGSEEDDLRFLDWKKYPNEHTYAPLVKKNKLVEGVGHNSIIFDDGVCYIVYHGRECDEAKTEEDTRSARIDQLAIDGNQLSVVWI